MRICPHCGNQIPDNKNNIYCPVCNQIADEEVLLRMKIEKKLNKTEKTPRQVKETSTKSVQNRTARQKGDDNTVGVYKDKNSYITVIISILVVAVIIVAVFFFGK